MFTNETVRNAIGHYLETHNIDDFTYDGCVGFEALNLFMVYNEAWELDFVCAYLDIVNGIDPDAKYPALPQLV